MSLALVLGLGLGGPQAVATERPELRVTPTKATAGESVLVEGWVPACPDTIDILSRAFKRGGDEFAGVPRISAKVRESGGYFRTKAQIPRTRAAGRYRVSARCGGGRVGGLTLRVLRADLAQTSPAARAAIDEGTIAVGRGAAGARLDMTRDEVVAKLGRPVTENDNAVMSYQPDVEESNALFDIYRHADSGRVRMITLAGFRGRSWKLGDGNAIFARGGIDRLYRHYGRRVRRVHDSVIDERAYVIRSRYRDRPVETRFVVDRLSRRKAEVLSVFIMFTDRGA